MKTPWSDLLKYGVTVTTVAVIAIGAVCLLAVLGVAVLVTKALVYMR